jgi:hypothetical protein
LFYIYVWYETHSYNNFLIVGECVAIVCDDEFAVVWLIKIELFLSEKVFFFLSL